MRRGQVQRATQQPGAKEAALPLAGLLDGGGGQPAAARPHGEQRSGQLLGLYSQDRLHHLQGGCELLFPIGEQPVGSHAQHPRLVLVHGPVHASWLNQIEIYFSIVQRKVLTPNDFASLSAVAERLLAFERYYETLAQPFEWTFTRRDLNKLLQKMTAESLAALSPAA